MTKARLTTWIDWDPDKTGIGADIGGPNVIELDIEVNPGDEPMTIVITDTAVQTSSRIEPKMNTLSASPITDGSKVWSDGGNRAVVVERHGDRCVITIHPGTIYAYNSVCDVSDLTPRRQA